MIQKWPRWKSALVYLTRHNHSFRNVVQRALLFKTGESPYFDGQTSTNWFLERLANAKSYLEFGSGGTTYAAAKMGVPFVSKESDLLFSLSVQKTIRDAGYATPNQHYVHADIGVTGTWGYPIKFKNVGDDQLARFAAYSDMPPTLRPDLILIDGRFRVACALKCIKALGDDTGWVIVVDDYVDRTGYHVIEEFAQLQKMVGRMAVFGAKSDLDLVALDEKISSHLYDCR